jgi:hypothetical protein
MKKIVFGLLMIMSFSNGSFAQNKKTTTLPKYDSKSFVWKGGDDKYYDVTFYMDWKKK